MAVPQSLLDAIAVLKTSIDQLAARIAALPTTADLESVSGAVKDAATQVDGLAKG